MAASRHLIEGEVQLLRKILDFAEGEGTAGAHALARVWRTLSVADQQATGRVAAVPSVLDHVVLRLTSAAAVRAKLDFYIHALAVAVRKVTLRSRGGGADAGLVEVALQHLSKCSELKSVRIAARSNGRRGVRR